MSKSYQCQVHDLRGKNKNGQCPVCATDAVMLKEAQFKLSGLCGGCHQWGVNPPIKNGRCITCDRTEEQIKKDHGTVRLGDLND